MIMKIKEIVENTRQIDEFMDEGTDVKISEADMQRILSVKDSDFGPPMTPEQFSVYLDKLTAEAQR